MATYNKLYLYYRVEKFEASDFIDPRSGRDGFKTSRKESKNGLDLEGWIDYTGWYPAKSGYNLPITSFVASNSVPGTVQNYLFFPNEGFYNTIAKYILSELTTIPATTSNLLVLILFAVTLVLPSLADDGVHCT